MFIFFPKCLHVVKLNIRINNILKIAQIITKKLNENAQSHHQKFVFIRPFKEMKQLKLCYPNIYSGIRNNGSDKTHYSVQKWK